MASMEKISFHPLIVHLQEKGDFYNQLYHEMELKYGLLDHAVISSWIVQIVEPVIREIYAYNPDHLPAAFKAFFTELLQLTGSNAIINSHVYQEGWKICSHMVPLFSRFPLRTLKAINSALNTVSQHKPEEVNKWISLMKQNSSQCNTIEEFLACGRINAWICGLAHLRERAARDFSSLRSELKEFVQECSGITNLEMAFKYEWPNITKPIFIGETGGFTGYGGSFVDSPLVAMVDNVVVATDKYSCCAFFGDNFGQVILDEIPVSPEKVTSLSSKNDLNYIKSKFGLNFISFNDISSCVIKNSTLVLTRSSSHYLYIFGLPHD
jgi:hypothetical protein